jgi:hypothetical protein
MAQGGNAFPDAFQPGETQTFTATWNQSDDNGQAVAAGSYEVLGGIACVDAAGSSACMPAAAPALGQLTPSQFRSNFVPFTIQ